MPDKITSKNLAYDQSLPPFLARLRGQQTSNANSPDPILAARRRPGRVRTASEEADDAPVVVDEEGNVVQLKTGQLDENGEVEAAADGSRKDDIVAKDAEVAAEKEKVAGIGAAKKRKVGKVIGGDDEEEDGADGADAAIARAVKATQKLANEPAEKEEKKSAPKASEKGGKKKAKKIKLSFGDDEG
ncbi:hypothetical protein SUNI508_03842 [Seiridium unicorne]|uniref:DUF4604 domain-containing protein n=1 Tax=Seiridium unicorne TaxID=138068 RepID=A0ABR2VAG1_9PEZI